MRNNLSNFSSVIQAKAESRWLAFPQRFRLEGTIRNYDRQPIELDLMVSARLNHLHVLFMLRMALVRRISEPDAQLVGISADMLGVVVEAVMIKDRLIDSGTSLIWKESHHLESSSLALTYRRLHITDWQLLVSYVFHYYMAHRQS